MPLTQYINNGEIESAYIEQGEGHPFLLVHGFTGSKLDFQDQLGWFADVRRVIAYDQRGHGESSNQGPYHFDQLVDDLVGVLDHLDIPQCDLLGHSMGGMVAMRAVLAQPQRFTSLVLMDTSAGPIRLLPDAVRERLVSVVEAEGGAGLYEMMKGRAAGSAEQRGIDYLGEDEHWRRIREKLGQLDPAAFRDLGVALERSAPVLEALGEIGCPTTVLVGEFDEPLVEPSRLIANRVPGASLAIIEGAAHCPQYENAERWRHVLRGHLQGL